MTKNILINFNWTVYHLFNALLTLSVCTIEHFMLNFSFQQQCLSVKWRNQPFCTLITAYYMAAKAHSRLSCKKKCVALFFYSAFFEIDLVSFWTLWNVKDIWLVFLQWFFLKVILSFVNDSWNENENKTF